MLDRAPTPGGLRSPRLVHVVEPNEVLTAQRDFFSARNIETAAIKHFKFDSLEAQKSQLGDGWIVNAGWTNDTGKPLSVFTTSWIVPEAPTSKSDPLQTIFLFNGIQNLGENYGILQPVLQWGLSAAVGSGDFWAIASWYAASDGQAFHTPLVRVNPGDRLVGIITSDFAQDGKFSYTCAFDGIPGTTLQIDGIEELRWFNETLEAYSIGACTDYPSTQKTVFESIEIRSADSILSPAWQIANNVTDCGQHIVVTSQTEMEIHYRNALA